MTSAPRRDDPEGRPAAHPRTLGWVGTTALARGGSNQSLLMLAAPELVLMFPDRVGGIAASCVEAFRPYRPVLANLTGVCHWWGGVTVCGLAAMLSASALPGGTCRRSR